MTGCLVLLLVTFLSPLLAADEGPVTNSASEALSSFVEENAGKVNPPVIALVPLRHEDGSKSMEGQLINEQVTTLLAERGRVRLVERDNLAKALEEQKLASEGFLSPETAARAGKVTGAKAILAGTITELGDVIELHVRLFSVETAEVIAARKVKARRTIKTFISPLWDDMDRIKAKGARFRARLWMQSDRLRIGDEATILFESERDCHVTIFDFATDGGITVLFPNRFHPDNSIKAGRRYEIPAEKDDFKIRVRGPAGIEHLKLFATTSDVPLYERDYSKSPFSTVNDGDQEFVRGLQVTIDKAPKTDWAESSYEFLIENILR